MTQTKKLAREQLDYSLTNLEPLRSLSVPPKGWIRAIRDVVGMSGRQLAARIGVSKQRVAEIERDERGGSVTLKTLRRVAESLDSVFVYGFIPHTSLERFVRERAREIAQERLARVSHTMNLESQGLTDRENDETLDELVDELVNTLPSFLWDQ